MSLKIYIAIFISFGINKIYYTILIDVLISSEKLRNLDGFE